MGRSIEQNIEQLNRRSFWEVHLERWQKSAVTATAYCKEHQLSIDSFKYWQYRILPHTRVSRGSKEFVEVSITEHTSRAVIEQTREAVSILLETPLGYKIHIPRDLSQTELSLLLFSLRQASC
jgi:hypothetical protein